MVDSLSLWGYDLSRWASGLIGGKTSIDDRIALKNALESFLRELPVKNKDVFLLRYFYPMPLDEIADRCEMSESAVKWTFKYI